METESHGQIYDYCDIAELFHYQQLYGKWRTGRTAGTYQVGALSPSFDPL